MSAYINRMISEGEHEMLDFKYQVKDAKKIARSISSFANTNGGKLLIGVKDNGKIAGIRTDEEYYMMETASEIICKPPVDIEAVNWNIEGKFILEVEIPKIDYGDPVKAPDPDGNLKAYARVNDMNIAIDDVVYGIWEMKRNNKGAYIKYTDDEKLILDYVDKFEKAGLTELTNNTGIIYSKLKKLLINLVVADILKLEINKNGGSYSINQ